MSFKLAARSYLAKLTEESRKLKQSPSPERLNKVNQYIMEFLESEAMFPLTTFLNDYGAKSTCEYGYLYNPVDDKIKPLLRFSKNLRSQFYCARYRLCDQGDIYIIPTESNPVSFVIVLKPSRPLRRDMIVIKKLVKGFPVTFVYPPFAELSGSFLKWAVAIESLAQSKG